MIGFNRLSIKSKLQLMLLVASLSSILVVGYLSWSKARSILTERIFNQLTSVRASKAYQLESYFTNLRNHLETLCENQMVVGAMVEFDTAFQQLTERPASPTWERAIATYYNQEFLPRLAKNLLDGTPTLETYWPTSPASQYLQYYYIASNPHAVGQKDELNRAGDNSRYSQVHSRYHPLFRNLIKRFGYYDLFLIDAETGDIIYSVYKETDFSSNLYTGPYRNSNLAEVARQVRDNPDRGAIQLVDFQFYRPSYNTPAAFIAGPIYDGSRRVGILAVQLPIDEINNVLTGNQNWKRDGLGDTGETYMVGADLRLRSASRLLIEQPADYLALLRQDGMRQDALRLVEHLQTSILLHPIDTPVARNALRGRSGTQKIASSYRGTSALSSYAPLNIAGVQWGIISEIAWTEAYTPIYELQRYLIISTVVLILLVTLYATFAAHQFMQPIDLMISRSHHSESDPLESNLTTTTKDELNELVQIFNQMMQQIRQKSDLIRQKEQENENLLLNLMPATVLKQWQQQSGLVVDQIQQVTVIVIQISDLIQLSKQRGSEQGAEQLNQLVISLEEKGEKYEVEQVSCFSDRFVAACGLSRSRLDHVKRAVDFAQDALVAVKTLNQTNGTSLSLRIGIHTGTVTAALIGHNKIHYDLWGEPLAIARQLEQQTEANTIRVSQAVYERVQDFFTFESAQPLLLGDNRSLATWVLGRSGLRDLIHELTFGLVFDEDDTPDAQSSKDDQ